MNDLDSRATYDAVDSARMAERLSGLPQQCREAYQNASALALLVDYQNIRHIILAGMGGSAISSSITQAIYGSAARVPITVWRDYGLPAFAQGADILVIVSSKSGDTEEALSAYDEAKKRRCKVMGVTTGGQLGRLAQSSGVPLFTFTFEHTPREAIGWLTLPLIAVLGRLGVIPDPAQDVAEAISVMAAANERIGIDSPAVRNPAKRLGGQVMDRQPIIYGAGILTPVARRWKAVLNENAKLLASWDELPELNHNTVIGYDRAEAVWQKSIVIQLRCAHDHPRVSRRYDITTRLLLEAGINQDTIRARGNSALAQVFSLVQFGDWVSFYAAAMSGIDPTPTDRIDQLKAELAQLDG